MILANLGLICFTAIGVALIAYLAFTMIHPESF